MVKHILSSYFKFGRNCAGKAIVWAVLWLFYLFVCFCPARAAPRRSFIRRRACASYFACPKQLDQKGTNDTFDPSFARNIATQFALHVFAAQAQRARLAIGLLLGSVNKNLFVIQK